jgi:hypothetical protein
MKHLKATQKQNSSKVRTEKLQKMPTSKLLTFRLHLFQQLRVALAQKQHTKVIISPNTKRQNWLFVKKKRL